MHEFGDEDHPLARSSKRVEVIGFPIAAGEASNARTISLSSAIVADLDPSRAVSERRKHVDGGKIGVIVTC
jgi:hypothetical protein